MLKSAKILSVSPFEQFISVTNNVEKQLLDRLSEITA